MKATDLLVRAEAHHSAYIDDLAQLVSIDSGSHDPEGVNRVGTWAATRLNELGFTVEHRASTDPRIGSPVIGRRSGTGTRRILLFAHLDTVFERGDAAARPFSIDDNNVAHGPGVTDDKAGIVAGLHAAAHLIETQQEPYGELILAFTPDEEVGSAVGGPVLTELARDADVAFCLECARENGDLVISRKGAVDFNIEVFGRAAHSGIEPERGAHAGLEAAHLTVFLQALADPSQNLTVNVGILRAGDRTNIVPDRAQLRVEMRATQGAVLSNALDAVRSRIAAPVVTGTRSELIIVDSCPPLEETEVSTRLGQLALTVANELGFTPGLARTGGVSDGNRVADLGVPTLDGLGPVGGGDHTPDEWLDLASVPTRVAFLAALISASSGSALDLAPDPGSAH